MKNSLFLLCSFVISSWQPITATAQLPTTIPGIDKGAKKPQVMVLGTFHFENPGKDLVKTSVADILSVERQKELRGLLDKIKEFKPTKIALEVESKSAEKIITRYSRYLAGQDTLRRNETDQIGFRLAKELGHKTVYCVDFKKDMDFGAIMKAAQEVGPKDFMNRFQQGMGFIQAESEKMQKLPLADHFHLLNNLQDAERLHGAYLLMATVGKDSNYTGANVIAGWYERNLKIAINVQRIVESSEDRILVLFGAGHLPLLYHFFKLSPDIEAVNVENYLTRKK
jgi:Family of unknown function (DUF5694)